MKAATFVFLLAAGGAVMRAQSSTAPSGEVTIAMSETENTPEYCRGPYPGFVFQRPRRGQGAQRGPDDITLGLPLKLQYENHRSETIIVPSWIHDLTRMTVDGQNGSTDLRSVGNGGMEVQSVMAMSSPNLQFSIIAGGKYAWSTAPEGVVIPVLDRSSGLDLRGKTVQIAMTRDFRSLAPEVVEKLNEKWKDYGTVWVGVVESNTVTFRIPEEPLTRDCMTTLVAK